MDNVKLGEGEGDALALAARLWFHPVESLLSHASDPNLATYSTIYHPHG